MARAKKAPKKKKTKAKTKATGKAKAKPPRAKAKSVPRKKGRSAGPTTEVEKRWNEYWDCRKQLEESIETVRAARAKLSEAQTIERERRAAFEETKRSLKQLLEVEPAAGGAGGGGNVFDLERDAEEA